MPTVLAAQTCTDTDGGINLGTFSTVSGTYSNGQAYSVSDFCSTSEANKISESYCVNADTGEIGGNYQTSIWKYCPSGEICQSGKCVSQTGTTCSSSGGSCRDLCYSGEQSIGILSCTGGDICCKTSTLSCQPGTTSYYCSSTNPHARFKCTNGITFSSLCNSGEICQSGDCVKEPVYVTPTCSDTDGKDTTTKGKVQGTSASGDDYFFYDLCSITDPSKVSEGSCSGNMGVSEWISCPSGSTCSDGACISSSEVESCTDLNGECKDICGIGEVAIGTGSAFSCENTYSCCRSQETRSCPTGTERPSCDDKNPFEYTICKNGMVTTVTCKNNHKCTDGLLCYGLTGESDNPIVKFFDGIKNIIDKAKDDIFGSEATCKNCDAFAMSITVGKILPSYTCEAKIISIPPQTATTCALSLLKLLFIPLAFVVVFVYINKFSSKFKSLRKNKKLQIILGLVLALIISYILYLVFYFGVILLVAYILISKSIKSVSF